MAVNIKLNTEVTAIHRCICIIPSRIKNLFYILLIGLSHSLYAQGNNTIISIGGDHNYPPYEFLNANGEPDGYNTELTKAIAEVMGIRVRIKLDSWDYMKKQLEEGKIDLLQGISYSQERAKIFGFTPPHSIVHQSVFARKGATPVININDLTDKWVLVQNNGIMFEQLVAANTNIHFVKTDTHAAALRLLASGQYDYAFVANLPGLYLGQELSLSNIEPVGNPLPPQIYGYAALKDKKELLALFSEGLAILKNTGKQQEIYNKWFGPLTEKKFDWQTIGLLAAGLSLFLTIIIGGVVIWNRSLTKQVARRTQKLALQQQQLIQADKMASLGILVSGVAHEINNPTGLLLLNLPVLKETFDDLDEILEEHYATHGDFYVAGLSYSRMREEIPLMLTDMLEGTQHIRRIVDDLRDFARQEPIDLLKMINFNQVVMTAVRLTDNTIRSATQNFSVNYLGHIPRIQGNAQRLQQVVINLIVNACQALNDIQQSISISTSYNSETKMVCLTVEDNGTGILDKHLSRLTDPFFTTKREQGGTGLGLSISSSIVEEHGGRLTFDSRQDEGTKVTLYLPKAEEQ
ncbi:transporter substrate-binding domain-containing protein [Psychromonas sp. PT13]|uniref:transporter substrate-binding domain-containing protein n=1 Tax=Psychromonas sp. PT13 TaxID=3439547 RepID=UPI003EBC6BFA